MSKIKSWGKVAALGLLAVFFVYKAYSFGMGHWECYAQWNESGMDHKYTLRGGCKIKKGSGWMPARNFRLQ